MISSSHRHLDEQRTQMNDVEDVSIVRSGDMDFISSREERLRLGMISSHLHLDEQRTQMNDVEETSIE